MCFPLYAASGLPIPVLVLAPKLVFESLDAPKDDGTE